MEKSHFKSLANRHLSMCLLNAFLFIIEVFNINLEYIYDSFYTYFTLKIEAESGTSFQETC